MPQSVHNTLNEKCEALAVQVAELKNAREATENDKHEVDDALHIAQVWCILASVRLLKRIARKTPST